MHPQDGAAAHGLETKLSDTTGSAGSDRTHSLTSGGQTNPLVQFEVTTMDNFTELRRVPHNTTACYYEATIVRHHLESGHKSEETMRFVSRRHMLELLDLWNCDSRWKYHSRIL
ncbi:hypothetical protein [Bradyrhizobium sp. SZCCHNRI2010]|uniref:hypothetical protein n=1 Tax=Bradyrhizobium sp. SZCCHNRI2010 TaxID=3057283 RepID=UPI0028E808C3|nr:hypothetical protein [Bradyrhizobium sp. SZCCHNRI2010]